MDGALGDLEAVGELAAGDAAFGLEEEKRGKETVGLHGRVLALSSNFFYIAGLIMTADVIYGNLRFELSRRDVSRPKENWPWSSRIFFWRS
jgi:hypothetical protein